eukprot:TRINITY_DN3617_c0_g1_i2.p2 TRINITY_DN3617_c0_g1~~TRINITY_DN3617_c0_g1_i2.p2  ORF type:complete len:194 (-),score=56.11 TRINITY_DN3617_c0_g1_i2:187-720(-)
MSLTPTVLWAQRKDTVYIKIDVPDLKDNPKLVVEPTKITFEGKSHDKTYACELGLFEEVDLEGSKWAVRARNIEFVLKKKNPGPFWPRLLSTAGKHFWLKADWNKWKDEDEADEDFGDLGDFDMGGMGGGMGGGFPGMGGMGGGFPGMGGMGGMGGFPGMGGLGEDEDDDEDGGLRF